MTECTVTLPSTVSCACAVSVALLGVERRRPVGQRIDLHHDRLRVGAAAVDDAPQDFSGDRGAVGILRDRHDDDFLAVRGLRRCRPSCRPASRRTGPTSPALRSAATIVTLPPRLGTSCHRRPLIFVRVGGQDQLEGRLVFDLALRVLRREPDVLDDGVVRVFRIELAESAPGDALDRERRPVGEDRIGV